jgi:hypothetical protein
LRNHEIPIDGVVAARIVLLRQVHTAMWWVLAPGAYARWWRHSHSGFQDRSPIRVALDDEDGFEKIIGTCMSAIW